MKGAGILWGVALAVAAAPTAYAHSWYPKECCSGEDCAPVEQIYRLGGEGGAGRWVITSKHGKAILPLGLPPRDSQDGRTHVCMRYSPFGELEVICLFTPHIM